MNSIDENRWRGQNMHPPLNPLHEVKQLIICICPVSRTSPRLLHAFVHVSNIKSDLSHCVLRAVLIESRDCRIEAFTVKRRHVVEEPRVVPVRIHEYAALAEILVQNLPAGGDPQLVSRVHILEIAVSSASIAVVARDRRLILLVQWMGVSEVHRPEPYIGGELIQDILRLVNQGVYLEI